MTIDDFIENVRFIGDYQCSRETMSPRLYGVAGTPLWDDMVEAGFETNKGLAQRITEYSFKDPQVDDRVMELYRTDDIRQAVMDFIGPDIVEEEAAEPHQAKPGDAKVWALRLDSNP